MADYPIPTQLVVDERLIPAANAQVTVYDLNDTGNTAPLALKDMNGTPIPNPITTTANALTPPIMVPVTDVKFVDPASGLALPVISVEGLRSAAQAAADNANAAKQWVAGITVGTVAQGAAPAVTIDSAGKFNFTLQKGADGRDGANVLPTDTAIRDAINDGGSQTTAALAAGYVRKQTGRVVSRVSTNGTDQADTLQAEIDALAAAGGGDIYLPQGTITLGSVVLKDLVNLIGVGKQTTILTPTGGSTAAGFVTIAAGPLRANLSHLTIQGKGITGQRGIYAKAAGTGGTPNHGGWWNSTLDGVLVRGFANDQIWLRGGGNDYLKPHQFLTFKDVEAYTTGSVPALRITGQVAQMDFIGHCQFDGPSGGGGTGTNVVITREVDDSLGNLSDIAPAAIRLGNVTVQDNKRGYTIERAGGVVIEGGWWENLAEGLEVNTASPLVRVKGLYSANVGANGGNGYVAKAANGSRVIVEECLFSSAADTHLVNSFSDMTQRENSVTDGTPVKTSGMTVNVGVGADGSISIGSARSVLVNGSATQLATITSKAGTDERISLKAWGGSVILTNTGNIHASGLAMPYTVPSNAVVTLVKYDLGATWNIESVSTQ